uniref:GIY-YIG domain-containing protein n=1 Tax=viral metagenome TaxID=1070528 RepID=A0A6C0ADN5_9ZZZZ
MTNLIYALELENNKWYIGKTSDIELKINEHKSKNNHNFWTYEYKIKNYEIIENPVKSKFSEDNLTKEYMMKYGIENVRGGSYLKFKLDEDEIKILKREFLHIEDKCVYCGDMDHHFFDCIFQYGTHQPEISLLEIIVIIIHIIRDFIFFIFGIEN